MAGILAVETPPRNVPEGGGDGTRIVIERPPPGPARGSYPLPAWGIALMGSLLVAIGVTYLLWRLREHLRR